MANKTPIQVEDNHDEELIKTGFLDLVGIFFGFLWFMRRMIIGFVLLAALGYGIYQVWKKPSETFDDPPALVATETEEIGELPAANIDFAPLIEESFVDKPDKPKVRTFDDIKIPKKEVVTYDPLVDSGTVDEIVEAILDLRDRWVGKDEPVIFLMNQRRAKLARRLMEMEISEDQKLFSLSEYIESVIVLDNVVCRDKMRTPEVRLAMEEIVDKYLRHEHSTIRAKASLAHVSIPLHDYAREQNGELLDEFAARLDQYAEQVFENSVASARLGAMVLWLRKLRDWDGKELPYCADVVNKMLDSQDPKIRTMGVGLRERVFFEHLEPNDLLSRVDQGDKEVRAVIQEFYQGIDANPDVRLVFYQVAVSLVEKFKQLEQKKDYDSLLDWLKEISGKIKSETKRTKILSAIEELEALPWGPKPVEPVEEPSDLPSAMQGASSTK